MPFLIGGFSPEQYRTYLDPSPESKPIRKSNPWFSHFKLSLYPVLAILINRLAYYIFHGLSVYPNNANLFKKFKEHKFTEISSKDDYQTVKGVFKLFKRCPGLNREELNEIGNKLKDVKKKFVAEPQTQQAGNSITSPQEPDQEPIIAQESDQEVEDEEGQLGSNEENLEDLKDEPSSNLENEAPVVALQSEFSPIKDPHSVVNDPDSSISSASREEEEEVKHESKDEHEPDTSQSQSELHSSSSEDDQHSSIASRITEEKNDATNPSHLPNVAEGLAHANDDLEDKKKQKLPIAEVPIPKEPLPPEIIKILEQPFPLSDLESLTVLFDQQGQPLKGKGLYRTNLAKMLMFENKLRVEKSMAADDRFVEYLKKADGAFHSAWMIAYNERKDLHAEFKKMFPSYLPELSQNGEVICTAAQFDWVIDFLSNRFPAIYKLAFDAPSVGIYQGRKMVSLAKFILTGQEVEAHENSSLHFACLRETLNRSTPILENEKEDNPLTKAGSFIDTLLVDSYGQIDENNCKEQLQKLTEAYVKDWLKRPGVILKFGDLTIRGGPERDAIKTSDWVSHVRDLYTKTLLAMSAEELIEEIHNLSKSRLAYSISKGFVNEIDSNEWETSCFPAALFEKIFKGDLEKASNNPQLLSSIRQTIVDAKFSDPETITTLAEKSGASPSLVEPLIRIRVLYLMAALGQSTTVPVVQDLTLRAKSMYDPAACDESESHPLSCASGEERILTFDSRFDQLSIDVKTSFKDLVKTCEIAQGHSSLKVSSISRRKGVKTQRVDLKDLRFNLYASQAQRRYLAAQIAPQALIENVQNLDRDVKKLKLLEKAKHYREGKRVHEGKKGILMLWNKNKFDSSSFAKFALDKESLGEALHQAQKMVTYCNTYSMLTHCKQLTPEQSVSFKRALDQIGNSITFGLSSIEEIYYSSEEQELNAIFEKVQMIRDLLNTQNEKMGVVGLPAPALILDRERSPSPISDEEVKSSDSDDEEEGVIGKDAGKTLNLTAKFTQNTFGYPTKETSDPKYLSWKIERYEDLFKGHQENILRYIEGIVSRIDQIFIQAKAKTAPEWLRQILPILKLCRKKVRVDAERFNPDYLNMVRESYTSLLKRVRKAADWSKANPHVCGAEHIDAICYHLYASLDLNSRCQEIFKTFVDLGNAALKGKNVTIHTFDNDQSYNLLQNLYLAHEQIKAVPNDAKAPVLRQLANSARGYFNGVWGVTSFDPNLQSNPMHVLFNKLIKKNGVEHVVKDIAMGSPTIEKGDDKAEINPEFLGFLRHYKRHGLVHFYINNQDCVPRAWKDGNESARCRALHDLAENEFKDTLVIITLSQNSSFYHQKGHQINELDSNSAKLFKDELIKQVFDGKSDETGNCIPVDLVKRFNLKGWSVGAINQIHQELFNKRENLDVDEKRVFIRLFYQNLSRKILIETEADSYNSSCKDRIDRGAATDAEDYAYLAILSDFMNEAHVINFFKMLIFVRAIIVRKRTIIKERLERLIETVKFMLDHQAQLKSLQLQLFPNVEITIDQFVRSESTS